jgi:hypothetical protein
MAQWSLHLLHPQVERHDAAGASCSCTPTAVSTMQLWQVTLKQRSAAAPPLTAEPDGNSHVIGGTASAVGPGRSASADQWNCTPCSSQGAAAVHESGGLHAPPSAALSALGATMIYTMYCCSEQHGCPNLLQDSWSPALVFCMATDPDPGRAPTGGKGMNDQLSHFVVYWPAVQPRASWLHAQRPGPVRPLSLFMYLCAQHRSSLRQHL